MSYPLARAPAPIDANLYPVLGKTGTPPVPKLLPQQFVWSDSRVCWNGANGGLNPCQTRPKRLRPPAGGCEWGRKAIVVFDRPNPTVYSCFSCKCCPKQHPGYACSAMIEQEKLDILRAPMQTKVTVEDLPLHPDARGFVVEPLQSDALSTQRNVHVAVTEPGAIRGNHYHMRGTEVFTVIGPALVRIKEGTKVTDTIIPTATAYRFTIPPGTSHAIQNTGTGPSLLVAFNTEVHDPDRPDVVRDVILEAMENQLPYLKRIRRRCRRSYKISSRATPPQ